MSDNSPRLKPGALWHLFGSRSPGVTLQEALDALGLCVTDAARLMGVTDRTLWALIEGKERVSQHLARRLARLTDIPASAWLELQAAWDTAQMRESEEKEEDGSR